MPTIWKVLGLATTLLAALSILFSALLYQSLIHSRINLTYRTCNEQNDRHDKTLHKLDVLIAHIPDPAQRRRAERGAAGSKALIETLAPHRNCRAVIRQRFGSDANPK